MGSASIEQVSAHPKIRLQLSQRRSLSINASAVILGAATLMLFCMLQHYRSISHRDPTSSFFDPKRAYNLGYSQQRIQEAQTYIHEIGGRPASTIIKHVGTPSLCVGIVTDARRADQSINSTVGSLLTGLRYETRWSIFLDILIGHTEPADHPDWRTEWMQKVPDRVLTYAEAGADLDKVRELEVEQWYANKTIYDYSILLQDCYDTGARYVLMLEDDILAGHGWVERTMAALNQVEVDMQTRLSERWLYLRLFYNEDLMGWHNGDWVRNMLWSSAVWAASTIGMVVLRSSSQNLRYYCRFGTLFILSVVFVPAAIALLFMAGRQTVWPLSEGIHEMNEYVCCAQSLVFPRHIIPDLLQRTNTAVAQYADWSIHTMLEELADQEKWVRWATVPALFQHLGATHALGNGFDDSPRRMWNFRFEEHVP